jgi:ABC-type multidrug transport system permease subunit
MEGIMLQQTNEVNVNPKEPYPNFFTTLHQLMLGQIEYTRLRILMIKLVYGLVIAYIVLNILLCILAVILPLFGVSMFAWILQQIGVLTVGQK